MAGPVLDLGLDGAIETVGTDSPPVSTHEVTETNVGVTAGLAAAF